MIHRSTMSNYPFMQNSFFTNNFWTKKDRASEVTKSPFSRRDASKYILFDTKWSRSKPDRSEGPKIIPKGHVAFHPIRLHERNAMKPTTCLHLFSIESYWQKTIHDEIASKWPHVTLQGWYDMTLQGWQIKQVMLWSRRAWNMIVWIAIGQIGHYGWIYMHYLISQ